MRAPLGRAALLAWLVLVCAVGASCGAIAGRGQACSAGASALPSDSVQDWVTYGDYLVEWQAAGESRVPPTPAESAEGATTITRLVHVESRRVLWRRPSAADRLAAPTALDVANGGWEVRGTREKPYEGVTPRLDVGRRYLAVLSFTDLSAMSTRPEGAEWIALDYFALDDDDRVVQRASEPCRSAELDEVVAGRSPADVAAVLAATPVDPAAQPYLGLDPVVRFQRAASDTVATSSYTPGPGPGEKE